MVSRFLSTALLAALAVALPAAAEGDSLTGFPTGPAPSDCQGLQCPATAAVCDVWEPCVEAATSSFAPASASEGPVCPPWDINLPNSNQPLTDTVILDPDGCLRRFVFRTLEELPMFGYAETLLVVDDPVTWTFWT